MRFRLRSSEQSTSLRHRVHGRPLTPPWPDGHTEIVLGMGCFWAGERRFWDLDGVWTTAVGFTPEHTEVVRVVFDPTVLPVQDLLEVFWAGHDPTVDQGRLYRSVIGTGDASLRPAIEAAVEGARVRFGPVTTRVVDGGFSYAGADQQQYHA